VTPLEVFLLVSLGISAALLAVVWARMNASVRRDRIAARERAEALAARDEWERQFIAAQANLDALGDANLDALFLLDGDRRIAWANPVAAEMFVVDADRGAVGQSFIGLVRDFELNQAVLDATTGHRPIVRQAAVDNRTLRIRAVPVEESGYTAVAVEDVTELQRLGRARRDFIANISHELRTPLANIDLAAQTLRNSTSRDPTLVKRMLDQIGSQVHALSQLAQEMMDLAQIESGQALLRLVPVAVAPLVQASVAGMSPNAELKGQHISLFLPGDLMVLADEQQVGRVISNLVHNAIKFAPQGGIISIYAQAEDEEDVRICVSDNGPGIPKDDQVRIFERFYKQDRARSKGGTGLGLAIARHIVEGHGGKIWVQSVPGQGATFCFTLPRA
jgi:two-component system, OmpR family, phosphate regulon sensor histidine kinase PhoR